MCRNSWRLQLMGRLLYYRDRIHFVNGLEAADAAVDIFFGGYVLSDSLGEGVVVG